MEIHTKILHRFYVRNRHSTMKRHMATATKAKTVDCTVVEYAMHVPLSEISNSRTSILTDRQTGASDIQAIMGKYALT
jgi:hypothetical protein